MQHSGLISVLFVLYHSSVCHLESILESQESHKSQLTSVTRVTDTSDTSNTSHKSDSHMKSH
jgi:hypothetical protein